MMNVLPLLDNFLYLTSNEKKTDSTWDRLFLKLFSLLVQTACCFHFLYIVDFELLVQHIS